MWRWVGIGDAKIKSIKRASRGHPVRLQERNRRLNHRKPVPRSPRYALPPKGRLYGAVPHQGMVLLRLGPEGGDASPGVFRKGYR
jgi:hypothetical protein